MTENLGIHTLESVQDLNFSLVIQNTKNRVVITKWRQNIIEIEYLLQLFLRN